METMKEPGLWSNLGTQGSLVVIWWLCISGSGETGYFDFLSMIWPWESRSITLQNYRELDRCILNLWSKSGDPSLNWWWAMVRISSKFWLWLNIWPWRSRSITAQRNRDLNQVALHLWYKFGDPSLNGPWVIARINMWLTNRLTHTRTHTHTNTDAGNDNTRRPNLASVKNHWTGIQLHCCLIVQIHMATNYCDNAIIQYEYIHRNFIECVFAKSDPTWNGAKYTSIYFPNQWLPCWLKHMCVINWSYH